LKTNFVGFPEVKWLVATIYRWGGQMYKLLVSNFLWI